MADERAPTDDLAMIRPMEAFRLLGIGRTLGYKMLREGAPPKVRIGLRAVAIPLAAIRAMIENPGPPPAPATASDPRAAGHEPRPRLRPGHCDMRDLAAGSSRGQSLIMYEASCASGT